VTGVFTLFIAYSFRHPHFPSLHRKASAPASTLRERSPTTPSSEEEFVRCFGKRLESRPFSARPRWTGELLRTL
jgi:hypothetical protein